MTTVEILDRIATPSSADELHELFRETVADPHASKAMEATVYNAFFRQACREGSPPDALGRREPRYADIHRFWGRVDTETSPDGCWPWTGSYTRRRYPAPIYSAGGKLWRARRFAFWQGVREPETDEEVYATCRNFRCVRPDHMATRPARRPGGTGRSWPADELLALMRAFHARHGRAPTAHDWPSATDEHPGIRTLIQRFGSLRRARAAAGLPEKQTPKATSAEKRKTHCAHGHELTPENTVTDRKGHRRCRVCYRENKRRYWLNGGKARRAQRRQDAA